MAERLDIKMPNPMAMTQSIVQIATKSQSLVQDFLQRQVSEGPLNMAESVNIGNAFLAMTQRMVANPSKLMEMQMGLWQDYMDLLQKTPWPFLGHKQQHLLSK